VYVVRTKKRWVRFRGEGGGEFVRFIRKKVRIICSLRENWRINATRNDIRAIDTNFHEIGLRELTPDELVDSVWRYVWGKTTERL